jgi:hypothetical protein
LRWRCRQAANTLAESPIRASMLVAVCVARLIMQERVPQSQTNLPPQEGIAVSFRCRGSPTLMHSASAWGRSSQTPTLLAQAMLLMDGVGCDACLHQ